MTRLPYYLVDPSPWPMMCALSSMSTTMGFINWFYYSNYTLLASSMIILLTSSMQWWRDIIREATYMGKHTSFTQNSLRLGMFLFISSEICFFMAFFWGFFHNSLAPSTELGMSWPPMGISTIDPFSIPLLNTTILLTSGFTVTWSHYSLMSKNRYSAIISLTITICLGMYFTILQVMEYSNTTFGISDSIFGSTFFLMTGFHGIHVVIGTLFLMINLFRMINYHFSMGHHFGFEAAAWYWHFVDVVWICLYICIYWWGSL